MSFILDALKKSESERQKAGAPALYEAKVAPPRRTLPLWLLVLAALLLVNLAGLAWVLLRGTHGVAQHSVAVQPPPAAPAPAPILQPPPPAAAVVQSAGPAGAGSPQNFAAAGAAPTAPAAEAAVRDANPGPPPADSTAGTAPAATGSTAASNEDDAPAVEPARNAAQPQPQPQLRAPTDQDVLSGLPDYGEAASAPGSTLPTLKLDLHAYSNNPADRFIMLNTLRLQEGDSTPQGVRIEAITPEGVVVSYQGTRYMLQR